MEIDNTIFQDLKSLKKKGFLKRLWNSLGNKDANYKGWPCNHVVGMSI